MMGRMDVPCEDRICIFLMMGPRSSSCASVLSMLLFVAPVSIRALTVFFLSFFMIVIFSTRPKTERFMASIDLPALLNVSSSVFRFILLNYSNVYISLTYGTFYLNPVRWKPWHNKCNLYLFYPKTHSEHPARMLSESISWQRKLLHRQ